MVPSGSVFEEAGLEDCHNGGHASKSIAIALQTLHLKKTLPCYFVTLSPPPAFSTLDEESWRFLNWVVFQKIEGMNFHSFSVFLPASCCPVGALLLDPSFTSCFWDLSHRLQIPLTCSVQILEQFSDLIQRSFLCTYSCRANKACHTSWSCRNSVLNFLFRLFPNICLQEGTPWTLLLPLLSSSAELICWSTALPSSTFKKKHKVPLPSPAPPLGSVSIRKMGMGIQKDELHLRQPIHAGNGSFLPLGIRIFIAKSNFYIELVQNYFTARCLYILFW